jgi:hypothetical protein
MSETQKFIPMAETKELSPMDGPYLLYAPGNSVWLPTWDSGVTTTLEVFNIDKHNPGQVTVNAGVAREDIFVRAREKRTITRSWYGVEINVVNTGGPPILVQTA